MNIIAEIKSQTYLHTLLSNNERNSEKEVCIRAVFNIKYEYDIGQQRQQFYGRRAK
jgi:hypothetical protein